MPAPSYPTATSIIAGENISFSVGHLSMAQIAELRRDHVVQLFETIDAYKELLNHPGEMQRSYGALSVILEMADGVAHLIALSTTEISREDASSLPVGVQLRAVVEILKLSAGGEVFGGLAPQFTDFLSRIHFQPEEVN